MKTTLLEKPDAGRVEGGDEARGAGCKFLTFRLADEEFGVEILKVREINKIMDITAVPRMPAHMKGVINLRGKVIPVIDLRLKFGLPEAEHTEQTCVIVINVGREIGIIVDTVSEVLDIKSQNIEPPPAMGKSMDASFILGMGKVGKAVKILLDIEQVMSSRELAAMEALVDVRADTNEADG
jgi:purine-binding chemotaxis protein CheW